MKNGNKVCAVIVTYNRKKYLIKLLEALELQTVKIDAFFIFDNHSTDGTDEELYNKGYIDLLCQKLVCKHLNNGIYSYYFRNEENSGGSGGFHDAIDMASNLGFEYLWCMDDDVCPNNDCLEKLLSHMSCDVRICIPTRTDDKHQDCAITKVNMSNPFVYLIGARKTRRYNNTIKEETIEVVDMTFEGPLIKTSLVREIGLPKADFFIIFDDSEFAARACKVTKILYCKDAVLHRQIIPSANSNALMNWKDYYGLRNQIWFDRNYGENVFVKVLRPRLLYIDLTLRALIKKKYSNINVIKKAYKDGMKDKLGKLVMPGTAGKDIKY